MDAPDLDDIAERPPLGPGTVLVRAGSSDTIYLLDEGRRRRITSAAVMDKYRFDCKQVFVIRHVVLDRIPLGAEWE